MLLFGSALRSYRDLPLRYAEAAPLHRNELAGTLHGLTRVRYVTQDDAHIFCTREQIEAELDGIARLPAATSTACSGSSRAPSSRRGPTTSSARDEEWDFTEGELVRGARAARDRVLRRRGRGLVLRAEDRPAHDRRRSAAPGSWGRSSSTRRCRRASASPTWAPDNHEHPVFVVHRAYFGSFERFIGILIEHYGGAFPFWLAPVQVRLLPVGEGHRDAVARRCASGSRPGLPRRRRRARRDGRQADPRRRAREDPVRRRLRRPRVRRVARRPRARRRPVDEEPRGAASELRDAACYALTSESRSGPVPHLRSPRSSGVQPSRIGTRNVAAACSGFVVQEGGTH